MLPFASLVRHCWKQNPPAPPYPPTYTWTSAPTSQPRSCLNNEVTSAAWLQPRHKESIVSITMRKNEGPLLMRRMWCPCHPLLQPRNPQPPTALPASGPLSHTSHHHPPTLHGPSLTVTLSSNLRENETFNSDSPSLFTCCDELASFCLPLMHVARIHTGKNKHYARSNTYLGDHTLTLIPLFFKYVTHNFKWKMYSWVWSCHSCLSSLCRMEAWIQRLIMTVVYPRWSQPLSSVNPTKGLKCSESWFSVQNPHFVSNSDDF